MNEKYREQEDEEPDDEEYSEEEDSQVKDPYAYLDIFQELQLYAGKKALFLIIPFLTGLPALIAFFILKPPSFDPKILIVILTLFWFYVLYGFSKIYLRKGPMLIINKEGINDTRLSTGLIKWQDIKYVRISETEKIENSLIIKLKQPEIRLLNLSGWKRFFLCPFGKWRKGDIEIHIFELNMDQYGLLKIVKDFIRKNNPDSLF